MKRGEKMIKMIMSKGLSENNLEKTEEEMSNVSEVVVQSHISATENIEPSNIVSTSKFCEIIDVEPLQTNLNSIRTPLTNLNNNVQTPNPITNISFSDSQITPYLPNDQPGPSRIIVQSPVSDSVSEETTDVLHSMISSNIVISESDISSEDDDDSCPNSIPDSQNDFSPDDTDNDPDFLLREDLAVSSSSEDETTTIIEIQENTVQDGNEKAKKGRKRKAVPEEWRKNKAKLLRNCGKAYISTSKSQKPMPERQMKPTCTEKCKLKCYNKISEEKRQLIFMNFWKMGDLDKQRQFINKHVTAIKPKYRYIREGSTRKDYNHAFNFEVDREILSCI